MGRNLDVNGDLISSSHDIDLLFLILGTDLSTPTLVNYAPPSCDNGGGFLWIDDARTDERVAWDPAEDDLTPPVGEPLVTELTFTVHFFGLASGRFTVDLATFDGRAKAGADYVPILLDTLHFSGLPEDQEITVYVLDDNIIERQQEDFGMQIGNVTQTDAADEIYVVRAAAVGTIDDDDKGGLVFRDVSTIGEGTNGQITPVTLPVARLIRDTTEDLLVTNPPPPGPLTTDIDLFISFDAAAAATAESIRMATLGEDYVASDDGPGLCGTIQIPSLQSTATSSPEFDIIGDQLVEGDERVGINYSLDSLAEPRAIGRDSRPYFWLTISNDDRAEIGFDVNSVLNVLEGNMQQDPILILSIILDAPVDRDVIVAFETDQVFPPIVNVANEWNPRFAVPPVPLRNGGDDYECSEGTLTWIAGTFGRKNIGVRIISDQVVEQHEVFNVNVFWPPAQGKGPYDSVGMNPLGSEVLVTIVNDDFPIFLLA